MFCKKENGIMKSVMLEQNFACVEYWLHARPWGFEFLFIQFRFLCDV